MAQITITLKEAYTELTDRPSTLYGVHSIYKIANDYIGLGVIDTSTLHLKNEKVEKFWQLFFANYADNEIACCQDTIKERYNTSVKFFLTLINFIELTFYNYCFWSCFFFWISPNYRKWINEFANFTLSPIKLSTAKVKSKIEVKEITAEEK